MIFDLKFRVEVESTQKATALRAKCAELLDGDPDVTLIHDGQAQAEQRYYVAGFDKASDKPFTETVEAQDQDEAEEKVTTKTRIVAAITPLP